MAIQERCVGRSAIENVIRGDLGLDILKGLSQQDLVCACLTSKSFQSVATKALYTSCEWTSWDHNKTPTVVPFLRTLLLSPGHRKYVKKITLQGDAAGGLFTDASLPALDIDSTTLWLGSRIIDQTKAPFSQAWQEEFANGKFDAILSLLLVLTSELRQLFVAQNFTKHNKLFGEMLLQVLTSTAKHNLPDFRTLQEMTYTLGWDRTRLQGERTGGILPLFYLPNVTRLNVDLGNPPSLIWPIQPPLATQLRSLALTYIRETQLTRIFTCVPSLEELAFELFCSDDYQNALNINVFDMDTLSEAVGVLRASLTHLTISAQTWPAEGAPEHPKVTSKGRFHGLHNFARLKHLRIPALFLTNFTLSARFDFQDIVPADIQILELGDDLCGYHLNFSDALETRKDTLLEDMQAWVSRIHGSIANRRPRISIIMTDEDAPYREVFVHAGQLCLDLT